MLEPILRICALNIIFEYLYDPNHRIIKSVECNSIIKLAECNRNINDLITKKIMKTIKFKSSDILEWPIDRLKNIEHLRVDVSADTNLLFLSQLFPKLKSLVFERDVIGPITQKLFPSSLTKLSMWYTEESTITTNSFPNNLTTLKFIFDFDQELSHILPPNLTKLHRGDDFNQTISKGDLPDNLIELSFGKDFAQPITQNMFPVTMKKIGLLEVKNYSNEKNMPDMIRTKITNSSTRFLERVEYMRIDAN